MKNKEGRHTGKKKKCVCYILVNKIIAREKEREMRRMCNEKTREEEQREK